MASKELRIIEEGGLVRFLIFLFGLALIVSSCNTNAPMEKTTPSASEPPKKETSTTPSWMILRSNEKEWRLNLREIGFDGVDSTTIDRVKFNQWLDGIEKELYRPPRSASFKGRQLQPHQDGQKVNREEIDSWLDEIHSYLDRPIEVPLVSITPPLTTSDLEKITEKRLGTYTTRFNPAHTNRTQNIRRSLEAIDYHVVDVGEVFSFNKVVGPRTIERGYLPAPVIVQGEYTEGVGGGICQTSSTLYNATDQAGLRIIERVSHSREVTYVPPGRDATVSWGGPDFRFQNQLNGPILLAGKMENGKITIDVYSSNNTDHQPRNVPQPPTQLPEEKRVPADKPLPLDEQDREENQPIQQEQEDMQREDQQFIEG